MFPLPDANTSRAACQLRYRLFHFGVLDMALRDSHIMYGFDRVDDVARRGYEKLPPQVLRAECPLAGRLDGGDEWACALRLYVRDLGVNGFGTAPRWERVCRGVTAEEPPGVAVEESSSTTAVGGEQHEAGDAEHDAGMPAGDDVPLGQQTQPRLGWTTWGFKLACKAAWAILKLIRKALALGFHCFRFLVCAIFPRSFLIQALLLGALSVVVYLFWPLIMASLAAAAKTALVWLGALLWTAVKHGVGWAVWSWSFLTPAMQCWLLERWELQGVADRARTELCRRVCGPSVWASCGLLVGFGTSFLVDSRDLLTMS